MRYCRNSQVKVYENTGRDLSELLEDAAETLREVEAGYVEVHSSLAENGDYLVIAYFHD